MYTCREKVMYGTRTVLTTSTQYGGRVRIDRQQTEDLTPLRHLRVYKKFFHGEFADILNNGLKGST